MANDWKDNDVVVEIKICDLEGALLGAEVYAPDGSRLVNDCWDMGAYGEFRFKLARLLLYLADEVLRQPRLDSIPAIPSQSETGGSHE